MTGDVIKTLQECSYTQTNKTLYNVIENNGADPILVKLKPEAQQYVFKKVYVAAERMKSHKLEDLDSIRESILGTEAI